MTSAANTRCVSAHHNYVICRHRNLGNLVGISIDRTTVIRRDSHVRVIMTKYIVHY